jgi:cell fate regulator YaaT (PSP1 superfamily)
MRQIGVRDVSKMLGGLGICGRPFCCSQFLDDFHPVSIKMAKEQGLSLNPSKISGTCGRLLCCLKYEQESYEYLAKVTPRVGSVVDTREGRGTVVENSLLTGKIKVQLDRRPEAIPTEFHRKEVRIVKGAKPQKEEADSEE